MFPFPFGVFLGRSRMSKMGYRDAYRVYSGHERALRASKSGLERRVSRLDPGDFGFCGGLPLAGRVKASLGTGVLPVVK